MNVRFMSAEDLDKRDEADTYALCGLLEKSDAGDDLILYLRDPNEFKARIGRYNKDLKKKTLSALEKTKGKTYLLIYCAPYEKDSLEVNQENGVVFVSEETYERFQMLRREAKKHLAEREEDEAEPEEKIVSDEEILAYIKKRDSGEGVSMQDILDEFKSAGDIYKQVLELMEAGELYEPRAGTIKALT